MDDLEPFLAKHPPFGGWRDEWIGVPLEFRACLANELPPRAYVGSVRAFVLRGDEALLVHSTPPILSVGGRGEPGETIHQTLLREVAEETGWRVSPIAVIGFIHTRHLDSQRPDWRRPAPDFIDPLFAVSADMHDPALRGTSETRCEFLPISAIRNLGLDPINLAFLDDALRKRSR